MKRYKTVYKNGVLFATLFVLCSCKGTHEMVREVPVYMHDTTLVQSVQKDSVYIQDSVFIYMVGDTVWVTKSVTKSVTKIKHDTLREMQEIPVEVVRTEVKEVEKPLKRWQKMLMWLGGGFVLCIVLSIAMFVLSLKEKI